MRSLTPISNNEKKKAVVIAIERELESAVIRSQTDPEVNTSLDTAIQVVSGQFPGTNLKTIREVWDDRENVKNAPY